MSETNARRVLSLLVVGVVVLAGFLVLATAPVRAAQANETSADLTASPVESPTAINPTSAEPDPALWRFKLSSSIRDAAILGSKELRDIVIYTEDMKSLTPLLNRYAVPMLADEAEGRISSFRTVPRSEGLVSTTVRVPAYAIAEIAKLPGVVGIEARNMPARADFTNYDLTQARQRIEELRNGGTLVAPPSGIEPVDWGVVRAHNAVDAWPVATGDGVTVAVQDWGLDFAHPNLVGRWATISDPNSPYDGYPIALHQESMWNNLELFTSDSDLLRLPFPLHASFVTATWWSDTSYQARADPTGNIEYRRGFYYDLDGDGVPDFQDTKRKSPTWASCPGAVSRIGRTYYVGGIVSQSGWYHVGINMDKYLEGLYCERPGILVVDSMSFGVYDTVYVDLDNDYDFTNNDPVTIGNPLAGWDINGDGFYDISGGLLYFIATQTGGASNEVVISAATGAETSATLASGWIETDALGAAGPGGGNLYTATMTLDGRYWPSATEDIWESLIDDTTGLGNEAGTTSQLTAGVNIMTGAAVDTAALLDAGYPVWLVFDIYNSTISLEEGVHYEIDRATGEITWLVDFPDGDFVEIIYQLETWRLNYDSGEVTFLNPPTAGAEVLATYNTGLAVPYANITAQRQGWDLYVPGPGDLVAFHGAFDLDEEHGTWVASNLAGNPVGNFFGILDIWGTAPDVRIVPVELPTSFDIAELFYFSSHGYDGIPGTGDEANIATNSWGFTSPQETGFTFLERYLYDLTTNVVPDFTILFAAGNNGPGYATSTPPNTAPGVITVGAGDNMNYRWLFGFDAGEAYYDWIFLQGAFGLGPFGDIAAFSSKGPTLMGTPEPDVYATGQFAFGGRPLNSACLAWFCDGLEAWDLWAGTSLATPVTAGVVALVYEAYNGAVGSNPNSSVAKEILMSSAQDMGFDVLQQGAGWVDALAAVGLASGAAGVRVSPSFVTPGTFDGVNRPAFVNQMAPGSSYTKSMTVYNPTGSNQTVNVGDAIYTKIGADYTFTVDVQVPAGARAERILKPTGLYASNGLTQLDATDLTARWDAAEFIRVSWVFTAPTAPPYTALELFDWYNYEHDWAQLVTESTIFSEVDQVLLVGSRGETKAFANAPVLAGFEFSRTSFGLMTEVPACAAISNATYTFNATTGEINLCAPLEDGEELTGTYEWYIPRSDGDTFQLAFGYIVPGSEIVKLNGVPWDAANWDLDYLTGVFTLNTDLAPGDRVDIAYSWDSPAYNGILERNRFTYGGFLPGAFTGAAQLRDPSGRVHDGLVLSIRDFNGARGPMAFTVEFYGKADAPWVTTTPSTLTVRAGGSASFDAAFSVPAGTAPGMYQGAIWVESAAEIVIVPFLVTVPATGLPLNFGGGVPSTSLYENSGIIQGAPSGPPWRQVGDSRLFWANFSALPAANRRMIYNLLLTSARSEGEITVYALAPDPDFTADAVYGPGTMLEVATTKEVVGASDTLFLNREFLHTDVFASGPVAIQVKALQSGAVVDGFTLDAGIMETNPNEVRVSTNKLAGSAPVSIVSQVPLQNGLGTAVTEQVVSVFEDLPVSSFPFPGGSFVAYLFSAPDRFRTEIPTGTIAATYTAFFHSGASDVDFGIFYDANCDGVYTVADDVIGTVMSTGANPETATLAFPAAGCYWVHAAGFEVAPTGGLYDLTLSINKIGVSAFEAVNEPTATVPALAPTGFDLAWNFPGDTAPGVKTGFLFVSPGFAPFALAQQINIFLNYDLTPPTFSAHIPAPGSVTNDATPGIFVQIDDPQAGSIARRGEINGASVRVWLDGLEITAIAAISVPHLTNQGYPTGTVLFTPSQPLADGPHTMLVSAADFAGNVGTTTWTFTVDTTAPPLEILAPTPGLVTSASSVTLLGRTAAGASVQVAGQDVAVDGAGQFSATISLSEGANPIDITAADAVGNVASTTVVVVRDTAAPALSLLRSSAGVLTNKDLTVISGVVSEPASVTVAGIPATVQADGSFAVAVSLVEGTNTISITATDSAGNQGTGSLSVVRDATPPTLTMAALPSETSSPTVTVSGTVEAGISFVTVNGQPVAVSGGTYSAEVALSFGSNVIFVEATDAAGNRAVVSAAVSYVPTGVTTAAVGLILLPVLTVIALLVGLAIGQARAGRGAPPKEPKEEAPPAEEEMPPEGGEL